MEPQVETDDHHVVELHDEPHQVIEPVAESPSCECPCCTNVAVSYHPLNLFLLYIHNDRTNQLDVAKTFISSNQRINYFWKFTEINKSWTLTNTMGFL